MTARAERIIVRDTGVKIAWYDEKPYLSSERLITFPVAVAVAVAFAVPGWFDGGEVRVPVVLGRALLFSGSGPLSSPSESESDWMENTLGRSLLLECTSLISALVVLFVCGVVVMLTLRILALLDCCCLLSISTDSGDIVIDELKLNCRKTWCGQGGRYDG